MVASAAPLTPILKPKMKTIEMNKTDSIIDKVFFTLCGIGMNPSRYATSEPAITGTIGNNNKITIANSQNVKVVGRNIA